MRIAGVPLRPAYALSFLVMGAVIGGSLVGPLILPFGPNDQDISRRLLPPDLSGQHLLGTDALGRDLFSRLLHAGRTSLLVGIAGALLAALIGVFLGLIAGFFEGKIGVGIMGLVDAQLALPFILLAMVVVSTLGASVSNLIAVLALSSWVFFARPVHAMTLSLKAREFVYAARSIGASDFKLLRWHILPHLLPMIVVIANVQVANVILFESGLSFLGMGVPAEVPSWGGMLSDSRAYLRIAYWLALFPGLALTLTVLSIGGMSGWVHEALDPHREQR